MTAASDLAGAEGSWRRRNISRWEKEVAEGGGEGSPGCPGSLALGRAVWRLHEASAYRGRERGLAQQCSPSVQFSHPQQWKTLMESYIPHAGDAELVIDIQPGSLGEVLQ